MTITLFFLSLYFIPVVGNYIFLKIDEKLDFLYDPIVREDVKEAWLIPGLNIAAFFFCVFTFSMILFFLCFEKVCRTPIKSIKMLYKNLNNKLFK